MEGLIPCTAILKDLLNQARKLNLIGLTLSSLLAEESNRLNRQDEASRLRALHASISQQVDEAKSLEIAARYSHNKAKLVTSLTGLVVGIAIQVASQNKGARAFSNHLLQNLGGKERPFGTVLVCIGPKGLPHDAQVISISELVRESNWEESELISKLRERGHLLLSEEAFSRLIDRLIGDVQEGRRLLPVPAEKLAEILTSSWVKLKTEKPRWVPYSRPQ